MARTAISAARTAASRYVSMAGDGAVVCESTPSIYEIDSSDFDFGTDDISVAFWYRIDNRIAAMGLLGKGATNNLADEAPGWSILYYPQGGNPLAYTTLGQEGDSTRASVYANGAPLQIGRWHHMAVTYDRDGSARIYVDGVQRGTGSISSKSGNIASSAKMGVACATRYNGTRTYSINGAISRLGFWRGVVLSSSQVLALSTRTKPPLYADLTNDLKTGLVAWWNFSDSSRLAISDHGNYTFTAVGTPASGTGPATMGTRSYSTVTANMRTRLEKQDWQVATKTAGFNSVSSAGSTREVNHRHYVYSDTTEIRLVYGAYYANTTKEDALANDIVIKAAIESSVGNRYPVTLNGSRAIVVPAGSLVVCDPVQLKVVAGDYFRSRSYAYGVGGGVIPISTYNAFGSTTGESYQTVDYVDGNESTASSGNGCCPAAILGRPTSGTRPPSVALLGDSLLRGANDSETVSGYGWARRVMQAKNIPFIQLSNAGERADGFLAKYNIRVQLGGYCKYVLVALGVNDIAAGQTFAQVQASLRAIYGLFPNSRIIGATLTPKTTTTDGYYTEANQSVFAYDADRALINNWIRSKPAPLWAVWDVAAAVESAGNPGKWIAYETEYDTGTATGGTANTLEDTTKSWTTSALRGKNCYILTGTGAGSYGKISNATTTTLTVTSNWATAPVAGDTYRIYSALTADGIHPGDLGHILMSGMVNPADLI